MDLLFNICSAIATQEGWFADPSKSAGAKAMRERNNPGNLRAAPWVTAAMIEGGYWKANTAAQGIAGLYHQVALDIARGVTLRALINKWAPAADGNDPGTYLHNVMSWSGISNADIPLCALLSIQKQG